MKKLWIASIFATLMLTVSLTSVVSANEVKDSNCKPTISELQVVRIERLLDRLESRINFILLRYGHIPEVEEKCEEVLDVIHSSRILDYSIICSILGNLGNTFASLYESLISILDNHPNNLILHLIIRPFLITVGYLTLFFYLIGSMFDCWDFPIS